VSPRPSPYVGPRAIRTGERLYGRDREVARLFDLLLAGRIVLMYSPSGAGKSSLLNAGLIPRLRAEGFVVRPTVRVGTEPPDGAPAGVNRYLLAALLSLDEDAPRTGSSICRGSPGGRGPRTSTPAARRSRSATRRRCC
jgi:energy-coupling factor transporter ATP-binding protein EcfA2